MNYAFYSFNHLLTKQLLGLSRWHTCDVCSYSTQRFLSKLNQVYSRFFCLLPHLVRPDAGLYLSDMSFAQVEHTQAALTDTASDALGQFIVQQTFVEIQFAPFLCAGSCSWRSNACLSTLIPIEDNSNERFNTSSQTSRSPFNPTCPFSATVDQSS